MKPLTPPFSPSDRQALRARLLVDRPLHWDLARALLAALEQAWDRLAHLEAAAPQRQAPSITRPTAAPAEVRASDARAIVDQAPAP